MADLAGCRGWLHDFFRQEIAPCFPRVPLPPPSPLTRLVGTGGTMTILARMEGRMTDFVREKIEGMCFNPSQIREWMVRLWSLPLAQRREIIGLPANRADVMLMGTAICEAVMDCFPFGELYVSTRGLRFGAILRKRDDLVL
jgi:exopolyphosphatase/guanosine-5'-triphosphate,3'-diphosphate pyrophosphatase